VTGAPPAVESWTGSTWAKWSFLFLVGFVVLQSLDYHWRRLPTSAAGYFARGRADYLLGEYESAAGNFGKSIALRPNEVEPYIWRAESYAKLADFGRAQPDVERALSLGPGYAKAHAASADLRAAAWDTEGAIREYTRAIELDPLYGRCYFERGKMLCDAGRFREASEDLRRAAAYLIEANQVSAQLLLWVARARGGDAAGATKELTQLVRKGTIRTNRFWNGAHFLAGEVDEPAFLSAAAATQGDQRENDVAEAYFLAGMKRMVAGDRAGAAPLLLKTLESEDDELYAYGRARVELTSLLLGFRPVRIDDARLAAAAVEPAGPAAEAGLAPGAILTAIDGKPASQETFLALLEEAAPGATVAFSTIGAAGSPAEVRLTLTPGTSSPTR